MINLLTEIRIRQAKPAEKAYKLFDGGRFVSRGHAAGPEIVAPQAPLRRQGKLLSLGCTHASDSSGRESSATTRANRSSQASPRALCAMLRRHLRRSPKVV